MKKPYRDSKISFWRDYNGDDRLIYDWDEVDELKMLEDETENLDGLPAYAKAEAYGNTLKYSDLQKYTKKTSWNQLRNSFDPHDNKDSYIYVSIGENFEALGKNLAVIKANPLTKSSAVFSDTEKLCDTLMKQIKKVENFPAKKMILEHLLDIADWAGESQTKGQGMKARSMFKGYFERAVRAKKTESSKYDDVRYYVADEAGEMIASIDQLMTNISRKDPRFFAQSPKIAKLFEESMDCLYAVRRELKEYI